MKGSKGKRRSDHGSQAYSPEAEIQVSKRIKITGDGIQANDAMAQNSIQDDEGDEDDDKEDKIGSSEGAEKNDDSSANSEDTDASDAISEDTDASDAISEEPQDRENGEATNSETDDEEKEHTSSNSGNSNENSEDEDKDEDDEEEEEEVRDHYETDSDYSENGEIWGHDGREPESVPDGTFTDPETEERYLRIEAREQADQARFNRERNLPLSEEEELALYNEDLRLYQAEERDEMEIRLAEAENEREQPYNRASVHRIDGDSNDNSLLSVVPADTVPGLSDRCTICLYGLHEDPDAEEENM